jgi:hypothetical protein
MSETIFGRRCCDAMRTSLPILIAAVAFCVSASLERAHAASLTVTPGARVVHKVPAKTKVVVTEPWVKPWVPSPWGPRWTANSWAWAEYDLHRFRPNCGYRAVPKYARWTGHDWLEQRVFTCHKT